MFEFHISTDSEAISKIVSRLIKQGVRQFVAVGGDGTFHQLINAILSQQSVSSTDFTVGIIPVGTGNDWIKTYGIDNTINKSINVIRKGNTIFQDVGLVKSEKSSHYFINMAGLGLTPFVVQQYQAWGSRLKFGSLNYLITTAICLFKYRGAVYHLSGEADFEFSGKLLSFNMGIGQYCGGGIRLAPRAVTDDRQFDFTLIHPIAIWRILVNIAKLFNGKILNHPKVDYYQGIAVSIDADEAFQIEADGELIPKAKAFTISLLPQCLSVLVP